MKTEPWPDFPNLKEIAKRFDFKLISIQDLIEYRLKTDSLIEEIVRVDMPTKYGHFKLVAFQGKKYIQRTPRPDQGRMERR